MKSVLNIRKILNYIPERTSGPLHKLILLQIMIIKLAIKFIIKIIPLGLDGRIGVSPLFQPNAAILHPKNCVWPIWKPCNIVVDGKTNVWQFQDVTVVDDI